MKFLTPFPYELAQIQQLLDSRIALAIDAYWHVAAGAELDTGRVRRCMAAALACLGLHAFTDADLDFANSLFWQAWEDADDDADTFAMRCALAGLWASGCIDARAVAGPKAPPPRAAQH